MPRPKHKLPEPPSQIPKEPNAVDVEVHWHDLSMVNATCDHVKDPHLADTFDSIATLHVQAMLSKLVAEHRSCIHSMQTEIRQLNEKLSKGDQEPNLEVARVFKSDDATCGTYEEERKQVTACAYDADDMMLPAQDAGGGQSEDRAMDPSAKVDWATAFHRLSATSGHTFMDKPSMGNSFMDLSKRMSFRERLQKLVHSHKFEVFTSGVILASSINMIFQQQYDGLDIGHIVRPSTHTQPASEVWPGAKTAFICFDFLFNALFCIELLLRFFAYGTASIFMAWMWFDTTVIVMGLLDLAIGEGGTGVNPTMMRLMRLVRLVRLLRLFKAMSAFDSLFLLLKALQASVHALGWSMLILVSVMTAIALFISQVLHNFMTDEEVDIATRDKAFQLFGTFSRAMLSMFEITLANWVPVCRFLIEDVHSGFFLFFLVYRCMFCFAVLKVVAAVFISETNRVMTSDSELTIMRSHRDLALFKTKVEKVLRAIDSDGDGTISWPEMVKFVSNLELSSWLATIGVDKADFEKLFWLIEVNGSVDIDKFLSMVGQLRGQAKTVDLLNLFKLLHNLDQKLQKTLHLEEDDVQARALVALAEDKGNEPQAQVLAALAENKGNGK